MQLIQSPRYDVINRDESWAVLFWESHFSKNVKLQRTFSIDLERGVVFGPSDLYVRNRFISGNLYHVLRSPLRDRRGNVVSHWLVFFGLILVWVFKLSLIELKIIYLRR